MDQAAEAIEIFLHSLRINHKLVDHPREAREGKVGLAQLIRHTAPFNVTGQPALAIPTGVGADRAPLAIQIVGRPFDEPSVLRFADAYERARGALPPPEFN